MSCVCKQECRYEKYVLMLFLQSLEMFYARDLLLVEYKVAERALTHKLAEYMQMFFFGYNVDCEYNKVGKGDQKRVYELIAQMKQQQGLRQPQDIKCNGDCDTCYPNKCVIFPDIIVHRRGTDDNLLVVEAKTEWSNASQNRDFEKLKALTKSTDYKYRMGLGFRFCETFDTTAKTISVFMKPDIEIGSSVISETCKFRLGEVGRIWKSRNYCNL